MTGPQLGRPRDGIREVADGVMMITRAVTNSYLVTTDDGILLIDAGLPRSWSLLTHALTALRATPDDLVSVLLTHGHFDHVGTLDRLQREHRVPIHVHPADAPLVRHPYRYDRESSRGLYPLAHPGGIPNLARMTFAGALGVRGVEAHGDLLAGEPTLGGLLPVATPGHTYGHLAFHLADRDLVFSGDALVTFDPYTGRPGPQIVARAATADSRAAMTALAGLAATRATTVLPGHGDVWGHGIHRAVAEAVTTGPH